MTRRYYAVLTRTDMPIIPYHVHAFDSAARRDAWCAGPVPRGFDVQPATAHAALRDIRADMRLDGVWGATVDEYLGRLRSVGTTAPMTPRRPTRPRTCTSGGAGAR